MQRRSRRIEENKRQRRNARHYFGGRKGAAVLEGSPTSAARPYGNSVNTKVKVNKLQW